MAAAAGASTPSPPPNIRTPPAPRWGYHDDWEPYTPRKSARLSSQRTANRTPSPAPPQRQKPSSPRKKLSEDQHTTAMVSPMPSPQKKRHPRPDSVHRASASTTSLAATHLTLPGASSEKPSKTTLSRAAGMLPTPSKTPQKPPSEKTVANINSFARNLFPPESSISSPRKKRAKQYSGMTLDSFNAEEIEEPIDIFTDTRERIPEKDESDENPFLSKAAPAESPKRRSKRRQVAIPGEGSQSIEDASHRDDGMVYVFRGKRFFRKFTADGAESRMRSPIKPRALFRERKEEEVFFEDEEATTDVEEHDVVDNEECPQTPSEAEHERAKTPEAPKYAPVSPPDTKRITRSANKLLDEASPVKKSGRRSPFDAWQRTKEHKKPTSTKRQADEVLSAPAKRSRV